MKRLGILSMLEVKIETGRKTPDQKAPCNDWKSAGLDREYGDKKFNRKYLDLTTYQCIFFVVAAAYEEMTLISAGAAPNANVHKQFERTVLLSNLSFYAFKDNLCQFSELPVFSAGDQSRAFGNSTTLRFLPFAPQQKVCSLNSAGVSSHPFRRFVVYL